jgi:hypothetical protein
LVAGCGIDIDAPHRWKGEHVEVRSDMPLDRWCNGFLPSVDSYVEHIKGMHDGPDDLRVTAYVLEDPADTYGACRRAGCARGRTTYTHRADSLYHELVHAVRSGRGNSPVFFEEGAATYWGGGDTPWFNAPSEPQLTDRLGDLVESSWNRRIQGMEYWHAAHFTGYLMHSYGRTANASFARRLDGDSSRGETARAFEGAMGATLEAAVEEYERTWLWCSGEAIQSSSFVCADEAFTITCGDDPEERRHTIDVDVYCDEATVTGPWYDARSKDEWISRTVVVELLEAGRHRLSAHLHDDVWDTRVTFKRCDTDCAEVDPIELFAHDPYNVESWESLELEPGRYVLRVSRPAQHPTTVQIAWWCQYG